MVFILVVEVAFVGVVVFLVVVLMGVGFVDTDVVDFFEVAVLGGRVAFVADFVVVLDTAPVVDKVVMVFFKDVMVFSCSVAFVFQVVYSVL